MKLYRFIDPATGDEVRAVERHGAFSRLRHSVQDFVELSKTDSPKVGTSFVANREHYLPPSMPSKIICVGLNYRKHAEEMDKQIPDEPLIFMKPPSALNSAYGDIVLPTQSQEVHHEGELALVIGRRARKVSEEDAMDYVMGFTCANDVTARDIQRREKRYTRGKGFDTFCVVGPCLVTPDEFDYKTAGVICRVNGEVRQDGRFDDFIFDLPHVISFISHIMTLEPEDIILTGTPSGVGPIQAGDLVEVEIEGIGKLENRVIAE